jgi:hypothetical protein
MEAPRSAKLENQFVGEGYYDLCLRVEELIALQEKLAAGPGALFNRFVRGEWEIQDVVEVVRLGLVGGGMHQKDAFDLVGRAIIPGYFHEYAVLAGSILSASLFGVDLEAVDDEGEELAPAIY